MSTRTKATSKTGRGRGNKRTSSLPAETVEYLKAWMMSPEHIAHPYPTEPEKAKIMADTGIELKQLTNWFVNNRKRYWKPRVEARLQQQAQAAAAAVQAHAAAVAAVTAAAQTNSVSPEQGFKPNLTISPGNAYVSFDLGASATAEKSGSFPHLVGTDFGRVLDNGNSSSRPEVRTVSETSSSVSVSASEGDLSDSSPDDDSSQGASGESVVEDVSHTQKVSEHESEQASGESSSPDAAIHCQQAITSSSKRYSQQEPVQSPRKKFRRFSLELWRESCQSAISAYDNDLPTLEEATQLFGYGQ